MVNTMAEISPSLESTVVKPGIHAKRMPLGATYPLAMAIAFTAWLTAEAPTARTLICGAS